MAAILWRWRGTDSASPRASFRLCAGCAAWLGAVVARASAPFVTTDAPHGSPTAASRALIFENQCHVCREIIDGPADGFVCQAGDARQSWGLARVCSACAAWIVGLAFDGRSARGEIERQIDGPYGEIAHPKLQHLTVEIAVKDIRVARAIREACDEMEIAWWLRGDGGLASVLFLEATLPERDGRAPRGQSRVLLASLRGRKSLAAKLDGRTAAWLTIPATPHQVAGALGRIAGHPEMSLAWDTETCLPRLNLAGSDRPALVVEPAQGVDRFEIAWLLRRFSRGYDDIGLAADKIVIVPRVPASTLDAVAARLEGVLDGRCRVTVQAAPLPYRRFEATG